MRQKIKNFQNTKRIIALVYFLCCFNYLEAQNDTLVFYPVNNQDLRQCDVRKITVAKDGKLWLSTDKGIVSYDGNDVHFFGHREGDSTSMWTSSISRSFSDAQGNLYIAAVERGIYYFDTKTGKAHYLDIKIKSEDSSGYYLPIPYTEIFIDNDETLWCGRTNMGFLHYDKVTQKSTSYHLPSASKNKHITVTSFKNDIGNPDILWLGTTNGICSFNKKTHELQRSFKCYKTSDSSVSDNKVLKIDILSKDTIWFITSPRGVGSYEIKTGIYTIYPCKREQSSKIDIEIDFAYMQPKSTYEYYIGSHDNYPGIFNIRTHEYVFNTKTNKPLPGISINHLVADNFGNLWCIIFGQLYLAKVMENKFSSITLRDLYNKNQLVNIFKTVVWNPKTKYYYVAFDNSNAIFVLDNNLKAFRSIPIEAAGQKETNVLDISLDKNGLIWACGTSLLAYDSVRQRMVPAWKLYPKLLFHEQYFQSITYRNEYLYLQPSNPAYKAIYRINTNSFTYDSIPIPLEIFPGESANNLSGKYLDVAVIDSKGRYAYIGISNYVLQLDLLQKKGKVVTQVPVKEYEHFFTMYWYALDDDDNLWITSGDGIRVYTPNNLKILKNISKEPNTYHLQIYNANGLGVMCVLYSEGVLLYDYRRNNKYHLSLEDGIMTLFNSGIACVNNILFVGAEFNAIQYISLEPIIHETVQSSCYLSAIQLFNKPYFTDTIPEYLHSLTLPHDKNFLTFTFSSTRFEQQERLEYSYKLTGVNEEWVLTNFSNRTITYNNLLPGSYNLYVAVKQPDGRWHNSQTNLHITINPAWWQTDWFKIACIVTACVFAFILIRWRISTVRRQEQEKAKQQQENSRIEKEMLELEAKALRAQMNPHFIFNCMNSIKSLVQQKEEDKAVNYLTTFAKLLRTILQNSDKREITLFDEIETCKLYTQLESMRFGNKLTYTFSVDETIDLKSITVPALILQPFIENAIWHGIMPKEEGGALHIDISGQGDKIYCVVEDNGIGRKLSRQNKFNAAASTHQSKGMRLTQSRLELSNTLNQRNASVEIIDKVNSVGEAEGTKVILVFREE